jgi:hypothetical protein
MKRSHGIEGHKSQLWWYLTTGLLSSLLDNKKVLEKKLKTQEFNKLLF